jgi:hypothetical protein
MHTYILAEMIRIATKSKVRAIGAYYAPLHRFFERQVVAQVPDNVYMDMLRVAKTEGENAHAVAVAFKVWACVLGCVCICMCACVCMCVRALEMRTLRLLLSSRNTGERFTRADYTNRKGKPEAMHIMTNTRARVQMLTPTHQSQGTHTRMYARAHTCRS